MGPDRSYPDEHQEPNPERWQHLHGTKRDKGMKKGLVVK